MADEMFCLKDGFVLREIAGEFLAVPVNSVENSSQLIVLNPVSAEIWKLLENEKTVAQLVDGITSEFSVSREEAEADIVAFLEQLKELNFLK
ncbi:MAG: PqqD family protein [Clostridia bacterium]|nr:PqqD family protein [Clostridia bacterium]